MLFIPCCVRGRGGLRLASDDVRGYHVVSDNHVVGEAAIGDEVRSSAVEDVHDVVGTVRGQVAIGEGGSKGAPDAGEKKRVLGCTSVSVEQDQCHGGTYHDVRREQPEDERG